MNMKLKLLDISLCRTPVFSTQDKLWEKWAELKSMISDASPSFYQIIEHFDVDDLKANTKTKFSVWKYFNRATHRATPYGRFAAFSLMPVLKEVETPIILNHDILAHQFTDWKQKENYIANSKMLLRSSAWFQINSTIYKSGQGHRYIRVKNGIFEVASVVGFPQLNALLKLCREKTAKETIYSAMEDEFQLPTREADDLLMQMLSLQLLLTEKCPNITGDYFKRLNIKSLNPDGPYLISERKILAGGLDGRKLRNIKDIIAFMAKNLPETANPALTSFRQAFFKKFEQRTVPLMVAMDLETGVGYGNLGEQETDHQLADILDHSRQSEQGERQIPYTELHRFLLNKLMKGDHIRLEEFESHKSSAALPLPNTLSVLLHFWQGKPVIESAGGCTANALLGRFTMANPELEKIGRNIASIEEKANPGILFFDIAYQAETEIDNVNRRKQLYNYELPIVTWSCNPSPLHCNDILVAVRGTEVVLWSKKYQKRMVPRIPSAYNYTRSDLAVFRFLCDLQHQQIKSDLNLKLNYWFPGLNFYPRVTYKNVIVSPKMWQLPRGLLNTAKSGDSTDSKTELTNWLRQEGINFLFKVGHADQTLCFNPFIDADIDAFLLYCHQNILNEIYISEALISGKDALKDNIGKDYAAQILVNYSHENQVYEPFKSTSAVIDVEQHSDQIIFPGGEWLYFEIYCHPARTNSVLLNQISEFLGEFKNTIQKWFFIRYDDPKPHIRLRLHLKNSSEGYLMISRLKSLLEADCKNGLITDIQIKTYFRETERYGAARIEMVERLFFADSKYVLGLLAATKSTDDLHAAALVMMQRLIAFALTDIDEQVIFTKNMAAHFSKEHALNQANFKKLNQRFQILKTDVNLDISSSSIKLPDQLNNAFAKVFNTCDNKDELKKLLTDLFHMHINRLFNSDQRSHEAILYQYLLKLLMTRRSLSNIPSER